MEHEGDSDTNYNWCAWYSHQRFGTGTRRLGNKRAMEDHPNYSIIEIDQNTEKSPGDLTRLVVTQIPVKNHQLTMAGKTLKREILIQVSLTGSVIWFGLGVLLM